MNEENIEEDDDIIEGFLYAADEAFCNSIKLDEEYCYVSEMCDKISDGSFVIPEDKKTDTINILTQLKEHWEGYKNSAEENVKELEKALEVLNK